MEESIQLTPEGLAALELLASGALSPLDRFPGKAEVDNGSACCGPLILPAGADPRTGQRITLRDRHNRRLAMLTVEEVFSAPGEAGHCVTGPLEVIALPRSPGFPELRRSPAEVRAAVAGYKAVVACSVQDWIDLELEAALVEAAERLDAAILVQLARPWHLGPNLVDFAQVRAARQFPSDRAVINLIPEIRPPEPARQALVEAIIHGNYGATHVLVSEGVSGLEGGGIEPVVFARSSRALRFREEVERIRAEVCVAPDRQGFCLWFTGLPSSGKSTIAEAVAVMLGERGRQVTLLDGDVVRTHLSKGLGFSREDRDTNIARIGFVASEIVRHHGAVICAAVSPYRAARERARSMIGPDQFVMVYVDTPAEVCEQRDVKGYYARARAGGMTAMTGVDDPYEPPDDAELRMDTVGSTPEENARRIVEHLEGRGFVKPAG